MDDYRAAVDYYHQSLAIVTYQPGMVFKLGINQLRTGNLEAAISEMQRAITLGERDVPALFNLDSAYYLQKDFTQAVRYFQMATARDTTNPEVYYNLGNAYASQGRFVEAIQAYNEAVIRNQQQPDYYNNLAMSYRVLGDFDAAISVFEDGLQRHGQAEILKTNAAQVRAEANNHQE